MKRNAGKILMVLGAMLLLAALALFCYNQMEDQRAGQSADNVTQQLLSVIPETPPEKPLADPLRQPDPEMEAVQVDGIGYIGVLELPTLGMSLAIAADWDYETLKSVPCRYSGSVETENLVLCGHNYRRHFGPIDRLRPGDPVIFTDMEGRVSLYQVLTAEELQPTDVESMVFSDCTLSLFTCTYSGQARYTVRCVPME